MIVTISQPRYLPWLGYFHRIAVSDVFVCLDTAQYTPRDWENRNKVKTPQGWTWLTVPVKAAYQACIPEVTVDNTQPWQSKHWRTIESFYAAAPYFSDYAPLLRPIYEAAWERLLDLNNALTRALCECLDLPQPRFIQASDLAVAGKGSELILNLCREVGATIYFSGAEGRNYLDAAAFAQAGIGLVYQEYCHPVYPQCHGPFQPYMAAIDLLFNCGPASRERLLQGQKPVYER